MARRHAGPAPAPVPDGAGDNYARAEALRTAGHPAKALLLYKAVIAGHPGFVAARHGLAAALAELGRTKEAAAVERYAAALEARALCAAAQADVRAGRLAEGEERYRRAAAICADTDEAILGLATVAAARGRPKSAVNWYRQYYIRHPDNVEIPHLVAAFSGDDQPARAGPDVVRAMFDRLADSYDSRAIGELRYCAPNLALAAIEEAWPGHPSELLALDAGCGTGLSGKPFRAMARRLDGVDLSPRMVALARARGIYDRLEVEDLATFLGAASGAYNLVIAVDSLPYFGDLAGVMRGAAAALRPGGHFALTLEWQAEDGWRLNSSGRYSHGEGYLRRTAAAFGLSVALGRRETAKREFGRPVAAQVAVLRRR
jgi:predicted TPR repeat methyltransferase